MSHEMNPAHAAQDYPQPCRDTRNDSLILEPIRYELQAHPVGTEGCDKLSSPSHPGLPVCRRGETEKGYARIITVGRFGNAGANMPIMQGNDRALGAAAHALRCKQASVIPH